MIVPSILVSRLAHKPTDTARAILKYKLEPYTTTHLLNGVAKGALTEAQAPKPSSRSLVQREKQGKVDAQSAPISYLRLLQRSPLPRTH